MITENSKISLPKYPETKKYEIANLIRVLLSLHKDIYIVGNDIEVEYYEGWGFYKVSIFRWSKSGSGCGTKEYRDKLWEHQKIMFSELFNMKYDSRPTWRWKDSHHYYNCEIETNANGDIPGITYFIEILEPTYTTNNIVEG